MALMHRVMKRIMLHSKPFCSFPVPKAGLHAQLFQLRVEVSKPWLVKHSLREAHQCSPKVSEQHDGDLEVLVAGACESVSRYSRNCGLSES